MMHAIFRSRRRVKQHRPTKKIFVKYQRMLNRFGVKLGALSPKMHLVLRIGSSFGDVFTLIYTVKRKSVCVYLSVLTLSLRIPGITGYN